MLTADYYINGILQKDRVVLSKAITIIESTKPEDNLLAEKIIQACLQTNRSSRRIGITGAPGAGKSTFINAFGKLLLEEKNSIAVLAIDPSSTISRGSILGDKTRMEDISNHPGCYIRPTASSSTMGGVARKTRETITLCETFGFDYIFIETVGVGQSETMVKNMVDLFLLLLLPNSGDELQGIKRGIMEMADMVIIHKSDKANEAAAKTAAAQIKLALHLLAPNEKNWTIPVMNVSSLEHTGLEECRQKLDSYFLQMENSGFLSHNRTHQQIHALEEHVIELLKSKLHSDHGILQLKTELEQRIIRREMDVSSAAKVLSEKLLR